MPFNPTYTGLNSEGAIYGAIFLDFAKRVGMATAVRAYHDSKALTFTAYHQYVQDNMREHGEAIDEVENNWDLIQR